MIIILSFIVQVFVYHAVPEQTDSTPYVTASMYEINEECPFEDRIIAVSRDMLDEYPFGSVVEITAGHYSGIYQVQDVMNARYSCSIDILIDEGMPLFCGKGTIIRLW